MRILWQTLQVWQWQNLMILEYFKKILWTFLYILSSVIEFPAISMQLHFTGEALRKESHIIPLLVSITWCFYICFALIITVTRMWCSPSRKFLSKKKDTMSEENWRGVVSNKNVNFTFTLINLILLLGQDKKGITKVYV